MVGVGTWFFFVWAIRSGQFHDIEEPKYKMLENEERSQQWMIVKKKTDICTRIRGLLKEMLKCPDGLFLSLWV
ncbi:MAG: Cytochrome oxidase maturation protein cbb3-type [Candidatus Scalindua rubra]|uniref:Cytochrome oxidase maturation protein cbb3-type n=1 Tax=Candidatus Scalindua rubra TaxID=1872076 RepID=A0A1E3X7Q2_9BACT|nr:MAG: Cytochrome oxidase maturation protein cbb3-type [Candidatus Scalindua rubra]